MGHIVARSGPHWVAIPIRCVVETMRPRPVMPIVNTPAYVMGASLIRGTPTAVINLAQLVAGTQSTNIQRFITVVAGERSVALAVDAVLGVRTLGAERPTDAPPLLRDAATDVVESLGRLDADLLVVLRTARLLEGVPS